MSSFGTWQAAVEVLKSVAVVFVVVSEVSPDEAVEVVDDIKDVVEVKASVVE